MATPVADASMSRGDAQRACLTNTSGAFLHIGKETYVLNPLAYNFKKCMMAKACPMCCKFKPTMIYTNADMSKGIEYTMKAGGCCEDPQYEVHKKGAFVPGSGFKEDTLLGYTYMPSEATPIWFTCCCYAPIGIGLWMIPPWIPGCMLCLSGPNHMYKTLCTSETIEYGIKDAATKTPWLTLQNDKTGCEKAFCCGMGTPVDNRKQNCAAFKKKNVFRNVERIMFDGSSKSGVHKNQVPRQKMAKITRTSLMHPESGPCVCCCAVEASPALGMMRIDMASEAKMAEATEDDMMRMSLMMMSADADWPLLDCCMDTPSGRAQNTVAVNSSGNDPKLHATVAYTDFETTLTNGLVDVGDFVEKLRAKANAAHNNAMG